MPKYYDKPILDREGWVDPPKPRRGLAIFFTVLFVAGFAIWAYLSAR